MTSALDPPVQPDALPSAGARPHCGRFRPWTAPALPIYATLAPHGGSCLSGDRWRLGSPRGVGSRSDQQTTPLYSVSQLFLLRLLNHPGGSWRAREIFLPIVGVDLPVTSRCKRRLCCRCHWQAESVRHLAKRKRRGLTLRHSTRRRLHCATLPFATQPRVLKETKKPLIELRRKLCRGRQLQARAR